jgi:hypothetical protein
LLLQPSAEANNSCRQQGYGVLMLGERPQMDVVGLPLEWADLARWMLEQLPETGGPEVVLVGTLEGSTGELELRLQQARHEWAQVASPSELYPQSQVMRQPAVPGWDREDLRILATTIGLHPDGWLETPSRLVIQLAEATRQVTRLRLSLYVPEEGRDPHPLKLEMTVERTGKVQALSLASGLTEVKLILPLQSGREDQSCWVLRLRGRPLAPSGNGHDGELYWPC